MKQILVTRSSMPAYEEYCDEIRGLWDTHWLTNMGPKHRQFLAVLERYLGVPHVTLCTNGHLALENAIAAQNNRLHLFPQILEAVQPQKRRPGNVERRAHGHLDQQRNGVRQP